jgi:hypothetical protein
VRAEYRSRGSKLATQRNSLLFNTNTIINNKRLFHTSLINLKSKSGGDSSNNNSKFNLILDNRNTSAILNRENSIYSIYNNIFLNSDYFLSNLTDILEELYDNNNNENTIFTLYFLIKPGLRSDLNKLINHFNKYPIRFIEDNIVLFYKNTGLLCSSNILVFYTLYDINNLKKISLSIKGQILNNIETIKDNIHKDLGNTIINYNTVDINSEIMLIIYATPAPTSSAEGVMSYLSAKSKGQSVPATLLRGQGHTPPAGVVLRSTTRGGDSVHCYAGSLLGCAALLCRLTRSAAAAQSSVRSRNFSTSQSLLRSDSHYTNKLNTAAVQSPGAPPLRRKQGRAPRSSVAVQSLSNLNSIYNSSSPIFEKLLITLVNGPLNETTQLKIEKFLKNQASELNKEKLESGESYKISNAIILQFLESKKSLEKLIENYKTNLILEDEELSILFSKIMYNLDTDFIISIIYGSLLNIIAASQQVNKHNMMLEVTTKLGKEIVQNYIFNSYNTYRCSAAATPPQQSMSVAATLTVLSRSCYAPGESGEVEQENKITLSS